MDAKDFDKIADKLMVFRGRLPKQWDLSSEYAKERVNDMKDLIEHMLNELDQLARLEEMGWIK